MNQITDYIVGLDLGTGSVGWAVVDMNHRLIKRNGKHLWGSRLFSNAETAESRRMSRSTRRRYNKRRERIRLLQAILEDIVLEKDPTFFIRLTHTSFLDEEDKMNVLGSDYKDNYNLFIDKDFNDLTYYKEYPTIYHLRKHLCESKEKADPRLIYLALHYIVKYRGNFLYEGQSFNMDVENVEERLSDVLNEFARINNIPYEDDEKKNLEILNVLKQGIAKKSKQDEIMRLISPAKEFKTAYKELANGFVGLKMNVSKMIVGSDIKQNDNDVSLKFSDANYDDQFTEASSVLGEYVEFVDSLHNVYSWVELQTIMGAAHTDSASISDAMISRYNKHHDDLVALKKCIKENKPDKYYEMFKSDKDNLRNYYNYINHPNKTPVEEFYKYVKKVIENIKTDEADQIRASIELETFMLKQNSRTNGSIPYQMQEDEMERILDNQGVYYSVLKEKREQLLSILTFRIPYYYGPLNENSEFAWIKRREGKENQRILPWNHEEVVDVDATAEEFIKRMTNFCTYFPDEEVLPKYSLLESKYEVYNELNKIRVDEHLLDPETKNRIFYDLFMKHKTVSEKTLRKWLINNQCGPIDENSKIEGFQKESQFSTSLTPWIDFTNIFGEINDTNFNLIEDIIYDLTIFEDKKILKRRLKKKYNLEEKQIAKIVKLKYSGWARLSKKLLCGISSNNKFGAQVTVLDVLEMSNLNLMQIINDEELGYVQQIEDAYVNPEEGKFTYEEVKQLAGSPALKRGIWQALQIVDEITKVMKNKPKYIYIEFERSEEEKERTLSQIKRIKNIYKDLDKQTKNEYERVINEIKDFDETKKISTERLYLYFTQMGKCMYSEKDLDIDLLDTYEIDHIVPQSLLKDNSLDNKVLVIKEQNQRKLDDLVVPADVRIKMVGFWARLHDLGLISPKKFYSLMKPEFSDKDKEKFINRQLVETRQITKHVTQIIKDHYPTTGVAAIRANLSHDFRVKFKIYKNRDINDYHHAHDAYIAAIIGGYMHDRFPNLHDSKAIYSEYIRTYRKNEKDKDKWNDGFIINSMKYSYELDNRIIWNPAWIDEIKKCFYYKDCYCTTKLDQNSGQMFKLTVLPNDKNSSKAVTEAKIPVNKTRGNVHKYGGFSGVQFIIAAIEGKKKKGKKYVEVRRTIGIPLHLKNAPLDEKIKYLEKESKLEQIRIIKEPIALNQLIEIEDGEFLMTSPEEIVNAKQLVLNEKQCELVDKIYKAISKNEYSKLDNVEVTKLYIELINKMKTLYPGYSNIADIFEKMTENFVNISMEEKSNVIRQMLIIMHRGPQNGVIKYDDFNIGDRIGRKRKKQFDLNSTIFVSQSPTGIYTKKYKL